MSEMMSERMLQCLIKVSLKRRALRGKSPRRGSLNPGQRAAQQAAFAPAASLTCAKDAAADA